ncbi:Neural cell adhesion molecule 1 [Frankliniella fusca]|uniref:Neural cell adhesion molecule 1 n=1 Tax=Frankliniella fusca TaxID=407009 RepID=A0AAE1LP42_9NEOP|nr:Neural cell adhesion molecule 1 [Frankliniella fusca]
MTEVTGVAPVCKTDGVVVVGAALHEHLRVRCRVAADPADAVSFFWQFNNSGNTYDVQESRPGPMTADLEYTALSERDYGTLACWATNEVGRQQEPCMFRVVQASAPGAVTNCSVVVSSQTGRLDVGCLPGHPGGLPQWFSLILLESHSGRVLFNSTTGEVDAEPAWSLDPSILSGQAPGSGPRGPVSLVVRAHNLKGHSAPAVLDDKLTRAGLNRDQLPELILGGPGGGSGLVGVAAVVLGILLPLGLLGLAVVVLVVRRRNALGALHNGHLDKVGHPGHNGAGHLGGLAGLAGLPGHKGGAAGCGGGAAGPGRRNSSLEINDGDQRYVVSYTLKAAQGQPDSKAPRAQLRPDILNTPRAAGAEPHPTRPDSLGTGDHGLAASLTASLTASALARRTLSPTSPGSGVSRPLGVPSPPERTPPPAPGLGGPLPLPLGLPSPSPAPHQTLNGSLRRNKGLFIATSIPGPESCV